MFKTRTFKLNGRLSTLLWNIAQWLIYRDACGQLTLHWSATLWRDRNVKYVLQLVMFCIPYWWEHSASWCTTLYIGDNVWKQAARNECLFLTLALKKSEWTSRCCLCTKKWSWYANVFQSILPLASDRLSQTLSYPSGAAFWILSLTPFLYPPSLLPSSNRIH